MGVRRTAFEWGRDGRRATAVAVALLLVLVLAPAALADTPTAQETPAGYVGTGYCVSPQYPSVMTFTPSVGGSLTRISVTLDYEGVGSDNLELQVYASNGSGGFTGPALASASTGAFQSTPGAPITETVTFSPGTHLDNGTSYALLAQDLNTVDTRCPAWADEGGVSSGDQETQYLNGTQFSRPGFPLTVYVNTVTPPACPGDPLMSAFNGSATLAPTCSGTDLSYSLASGPSHGTLSNVGADGSATYTPDHDFAGTDSFTLNVVDSTGQATTDTVTVTVARPPAPSCAGDGAATAFNTPVEVTFSCTGTELTYAVTGTPPGGSLGPISDNTVDYHPASGFQGDDSFTITATDPTGQSATDTVTVSVAGPQNVKDDPNDQLSTQTAESGFSLQSGQSQSLSLSCPSGQIATDGHPLIQAVDQGTGTVADVQVTQEQATSAGTYTFTLHNPLAGQAQGQLYLSCIGASTSQGHTLALSSPVASNLTLAAGQSATTLTCPAGSTAIAPGYAVSAPAQASPADVTLATGAPVNGGRAWRFAFDAAGTASVRATVSCLGYTASDGYLLNEFASSQTVSVSGSSPEQTSLACPVDTVAALGGYSAPGGATLTGEQPEGRSMIMWLTGSGSTSASATLSVLCLGLTTATTTSTVTPPSDPDPTSSGNPSPSDATSTPTPAADTTPAPAAPATASHASAAATPAAGGPVSPAAAVASTPQSVVATGLAAASASAVSAAPHGAVRATLTLPVAGASATVRGYATVRHRRILVLSVLRVGLRGGRLTLSAPLNRTGRALLGAERHLRVSVSVTVTRSGARTTTLTRTLELR